MNAQIYAHIDDILEVNASWRDSFNELGCLLAFDYDPMLEGSILVDVIMEEHNISEERAISELIEYAVDRKWVWDPCTIEDNEQYVVETLTNYGGEGQEDYDVWRMSR